MTEWAFKHLDEPIDSQDPSEYSKTYMEAIMENGTVERNERIVTPKMMIYLDELNENVEDSD
ncbi:6592_t:CDS:2 [Funneliformis geosporum]|uniref:6592_t:CDS:1 n=1 Tax=Funneliformis geosporum TaxID=1117311 RepID=A0A9W4WHJ8_9GLOM|nr:6592_t:CDS:2 [Funneliformis geosporum]